MTNDELPEGWLSCSLGDVVDYGKTTKAEPSEIEESAWILELEDIEKDTSKLLERRTFADRQSKSTKNRFEVGDVLYGKLRPYLNKVIIADQPGYCTTEIIPLKPNTALEGRFLFSWLKHPVFLDYVSNVSHGLNMPRLGTDAGKAAPFILAPLAEQKRIADKLEAVLGRVDACRARLDRVPDLLKRFRQSVLAAATSGQLTEDWREENAANDEWENVEVGDLMQAKPRNGYSPRAVDFETPVRSLTLTATTSGRFRGEHSKFIDEEIPTTSHLWLEPGDILIQRANTIEYVGVSAIFDGPSKKFIYPDLMMKCRANKRTTTGFLHLLLQSEGVRRHFRENATGTAGNMPKINQGTVTSAPASLPSLPEQQEIVRRVEALFAFADRIEARLTGARVQVERLTPATLHKAFRGDLVPQDPNDETASRLLKRLRERELEVLPRRSPRQTTKTKRSNVPSSTTSTLATNADDSLKGAESNAGHASEGHALAASQQTEPPKAPKSNAAMTKSRFDDDVKDQPYLASLLKQAGKPQKATELFKVAQLPIVDFYKQLTLEVERGHVKENGKELEAAS